MLGKARGGVKNEEEPPCSTERVPKGSLDCRLDLRLDAKTKAGAGDGQL